LRRTLRRRASACALGLLGACIALSLFLALALADTPVPVEIGYRIVATYPHDRQAYTQGLVYAGGALYESTGLYGRSSVRRVDLKSGRPLAIRPLAPHYFGEGLTAFEDRLIQLTWQSGTAFVYARASLRAIAEFRYTTQGWGLTHDGEHLIMSDGSDSLVFLDAQRFNEVRRIHVHDARGPVEYLNELEYIGDSIFANVWQSPRILRIDPQSGRVTGFIDLSELVNRMRREPSSDVLNGIAYIPGSGRLLITGKQWPYLYAIELEKPP
jgi:glutamine cyclotransferase